MNGHVKPWELKPQQKDLMQVLRRPVETTCHVWTSSNRGRVISVPFTAVRAWSARFAEKMGDHHDHLCRPGRFTEDHDALHCRWRRSSTLAWGVRLVP